MSAATRTGRPFTMALALLASAAAHSQPPGDAAGSPAADAPTDEETAKEFVFIDEKASEEGVFSFDFGVPSSPSLKLLGQPEDKVTVVNGLKPFILQLPKILGNGDGGQSLGLDFAPAWLLEDASERRVSTYTSRGRMYRILYRTHIGGALYEGSSDSDPAKARASRLALGASTSLSDGNDLLMATASVDGKAYGWGPCTDRNSELMATTVHNIKFNKDADRRGLLDDQTALETELFALEPKVRQGNATQMEIARLAELRLKLSAVDEKLTAITARDQKVLSGQWSKEKAATVFPECRKEANLVAQYGESFNLGFGGLWEGTPGKLKGFSNSGWVGWVSYRRPLMRSFDVDDKGALKIINHWMIGLSARASVDEIVETGIAATPRVKADVFDGWAGLERLAPDSRIGLQIGYQIRDTEGVLAEFDRKRLRYFGSYAQRLGGEKSGIWLQVGYGHVRSSDDDDEALSVSLIFAPPSPANLFGTK
ncbi:MAG TPA: hypothetical protein VF548_11515 [Allosphingosinicella sp.]|jgi:hypothetical protein